MASSSSNPSSASYSYSATSNPSAALALSDFERVRPRLATRAAARVLPEEDWPQLGTRAAAPPTNPARAHRRRRRSRNSAGVPLPRNSGVSQHVPQSGWESAADPTSMVAPVMWSTEEGSSSSVLARSERFASSSTVASSTPTDAKPASAASSSNTPSPDIMLVPNTSGSAVAVATSGNTAPELHAFTFSAPDVTTSTALEPDATFTTNPSAPVVAKIVDAALEPADADASASTSSSAPGVTTIANPSATTSAPGAASTTIPSLRDNWVAIHWGIVPRPPSVERRPEQQAFGGNGGMPPVQAPYRPDPLCPWREQAVPPPSFGVRPCSVCRLQPARVVARPCGHLAICGRCYSYANINRFVCPCCGSPITWQLWR